jgi:uncharacterized protein (TIGR03435 family)
MSQRLLLHLSTVYLPICAFAQPGAATTGAIAFEVASIKPSPPPEPNPFGFPTRPSIQMGPGGRVDATQATLVDLILRAYDLQDFQVTGGPKWITSDRFEVAARAGTNFSGDTQHIRPMMLDLLSERFKLRVHTENRELPVYHLVVARQDGKLGTQLRPAAVDCAAVRARRGLGVEPPADGSEPDCRPSFNVNVKAATMTIELQGESMAELARILHLPDTGRTVLDKTGLAGSFDAELTFAPEPLPGFPRLPGSENGVSLFTALQEQLGLKLAPDRGPVEILVIDGAEHPTGN